MQLITTPAELRSSLAGLRSTSDGSRTTSPSTTSVGLVPTMGALHAGHLSLVAAARAECRLVVASIFVNPLQFAPTEDLARYPRPFAEDCRLLEAAGVDLLFAPTPEAMYTGPAQAFVEVPGIGDRLDGASRPGHFRGVATVVTKLFHLVGPDLAYFGQKDAAQVAVLRAMVAALNFPLTLRVLPTVREPDGLAMSSRNRYLTTGQRTEALALIHTLHAAEALFVAGETSPAALERCMTETLAAEAGPDARLDYAAAVDPDTLEPVTNARPGTLLAIAAFLGTTRLIDNLVLPEAPHA